MSHLHFYESFTAPPMMSFLPTTRNSSALSRSLSTPMLSKEDSSAKSKKSFKGLKAWWSKISSRFNNVKNRENNFSHSVSINIIPDESDIEQIELDDQNGGANETLFTLGFSAATIDQPSNSIPIVQPPDIPEIIMPEKNGSKIPEEPFIDTLKLLTNYKARMRSNHPSESFKSSISSEKQLKKSRSRSRTTSQSEVMRNILEGLHLESYIHIFIQHEVDLEAFKLLSEPDLVEMGITNSKVRHKIMRTIKKLKNRK